MKAKRSRGRPSGSSVKNETDLPLLERVADLMVRDIKMKPTTAMRALGVEDERDQRRLREKWGPLKERYLSEARDRKRGQHLEALAIVGRQLQAERLKFAVIPPSAVMQVGETLRQWARENPKIVESMSRFMITPFKG